MNEHSARVVAVHAIREAVAGRAYVSESLRRSELHGRDQGFAREIALGAVRHAHTISHILAALARVEERRTPADLRAILHAAAYQLIWMDRVPEFAAVHEAVRQARAVVGARSAGMVNAALRNLTRAISERRAPWSGLDERVVRVSWDEACLFSVAVLPHVDPRSSAGQRAGHLSIATGEGPARYAALRAAVGPEHVESVAWADQAIPPVALQRNPLIISGEEFVRRVSAECSGVPEAGPDVAFLAADARFSAMSEPGGLLAEGGGFVQDVTASQAALLLEARPGERILDLCAAPGGKTAALAAGLHGEGEVVACDIDAARVERLARNVARLRLANVRVQTVSEGDEALRGVDGVFDAALVDVPCSNTGVVARRPEARLRWSPASVQDLTKTQLKLLRRAATRIRPKGRLVYSTCSIEPAENQQVIAQFLRGRRDWRLEEEHKSLPTWGKALSTWRDGGYAARLRRES